MTARWKKIRYSFDLKVALLLFGVTIIILWQMLLPGYVLTLDMVFTPFVDFPALVNESRHFWPVRFLIYIVSLLLPVWFIQKIILLGLFWSIGFATYRFVPLVENRFARILCALFAMLNPFVYERFLAGQWQLLYAYALLPVFFHFLLRFFSLRQPSAWFKLIITLFLIALVSLHFFAIAILIFLFYAVIVVTKGLFDRDRNNPGLIKKIFGCLVLLVVVTAYWIFPLLSYTGKASFAFPLADWEAFAPGTRSTIPVWLNLLSLNGFWGERYPWANYFVWPQDFLTFWIALVIVLIVAAYGAVIRLRSKKEYLTSIFLIAVSIFAFIFSTGVADTIFKNLNLWLYQHIFFWPGFRDSQKFSGVLAVIYIIFFGIGIERILSYCETRSVRLWQGILAVAVIILGMFGYLLLGGFQKQLKAVDYPDSWYSARDIVQKNSSDKKILFLPWHGYFSLQFNNSLVTANPGRLFFGPNTIISRNAEIGDIAHENSDTPYTILDNSIALNSRREMDDMATLLAFQNIGYIVLVRDIEKNDPLSYSFLQQPGFTLLLDTSQIRVYRLFVTP